MSHHHAPNSHQALDKRLWASVLLNATITLTEFVGGLVSGSLALLSDAAHNLSDVVAVVLVVWSRKAARRPPSLRHTYGLKRVEVLAALINAITLVAVTALIARQAVSHLLHPTPVAQGIMLAVAVAALLANLGSVLLLRDHEHADVNVRAAFLHMLQDSLASLAVVVAALLARTSVGPYVDAVAALAVALLVLRSGLSLGWETLSTILEGAPADVSVIEVADGVARAFAPARLHHIHVWEIGPHQRLLTAHLLLGAERDGRQIESILGDIKRFLREQWAIDHATIEPEITCCEQSGVLGHWSPEMGSRGTGSSGGGTRH
jgi:cobalt-zinc-cadmium efflux system protein